MACNIERPSPTVLFDRYKAMFENTVLGGANAIPESNEWYAISVNYAVAESFYAIMEQAFRELDPRQACEENLYEMAAKDGIFPRAAVAAQGYVKLTGMPNTPIPPGIEFSVNGETFLPAPGALQPVQLDANGEAVMRVQAIEAGSIGNLTAVVADVVGGEMDIDPTAEICGGAFCNGSDAECLPEFRERYLRRLRFSPRATNEWILDKFLEWPCLTRALLREGTCCDCGDCADTDCPECRGRPSYYILFDGSFENGIPPESVRAEVEEWMFGTPQGYGLGQVEIGVCGRIGMISPLHVNVGVEFVGCVSSAEVSQARQLVLDYFGTVEPSKPISTEAISNTIERALPGTKVNVLFDLVDPSLAYGPEFGPNVDGVTAVFVTPCAMEPDCDFMMVLNELNVTFDTTLAGECV